MNLSETPTTLASAILVVVAIVLAILTYMVYYYADKYFTAVGAADIITDADMLIAKPHLATAKNYLWGALAAAAIMFVLIAILMWSHFGLAAAVGTVAVGLVVAYMAVWYIALFCKVGRGLDALGAPIPIAGGNAADVSRAYASYIYSFITAFFLASITSLVIAIWSVYKVRSSKTGYSTVDGDAKVAGMGASGRHNMWGNNRMPAANTRNWYATA